MLYAVNNKKNLGTRVLKFMESGHSYLECDSMHATIESLFHTRMASLNVQRQNKTSTIPGYRNGYKDFSDVKGLATVVVLKVSTKTNNKKVNWLNIKWIQLQQTKLWMIQYKYDVSEHSFFEIDVPTKKN